MNRFGYSLLERFLFPFYEIQPELLKQRMAGKTVVITGATFGIGESIARTLAKHGAHLILIARTEERLHLLSAELSKDGSTITCIPCDLYDPEAVGQLSKKLAEVEGGVDVFINNAGKSIHRSIWESLDRHHDFTRTIQLNYLSPVALAMALVPALAEKKGQIIHISAINTLLPAAPGWAAYQASKVAMKEWVESTSEELEQKGIVSSIVYLPLVRTRMIAPTEAYKNAPAMHPDHVAMVVANLLTSRKRSFKPWWLLVIRPFVGLTKSFWRRRMSTLK